MLYRLGGRGRGRWEEGVGECEGGSREEGKKRECVHLLNNRLRSLRLQCFRVRLVGDSHFLLLLRFERDHLEKFQDNQNLNCGS